MKIKGKIEKKQLNNYLIALLNNALKDEED